MVEKELLFSLFKEGWSSRKINKALKIHRKTISRYRAEWKREQASGLNISCADGPPPSDSVPCQSVPPKCPPEGVAHFQLPTGSESDQLIVSKSQAAKFHVTIHQKLEYGQHAQSIFQDLVTEHDYHGSYDSIKRYVRQLKQNTPNLYARIETSPGEEAQADFGRGALVLQNGIYRRPWLFVMTLCNSRKAYQEAVWHQDVETFLNCHAHAFAYFGGVTKIVRIDNLKSAVLQAHLYEPQLNPNYLAFSQHYGFIPIPCKVRTPEQKGKVESGVKYVQNNALKGKRFASLEEQNNYLRTWNKNWASKRIHGTTKRQVEQMFQEEKAALIPLPTTPFEFFKIGIRKVNALDSHIEVAGAYYPVPPKYMGKHVTLHFNANTIKIFYADKLIQRLSAVPKGHFHPDKSCLPEHKNYSQLRYLQKLFDQCEQLGPAVLKWAKEAETLRKQAAYRAIQGIVTLSRKYSAAVLNWACQKSLDRNAFNYHIVKEMAEARSAQLKVQQEIQFIQENELIRSPKEYQSLLSGGD